MAMAFYWGHRMWSRMDPAACLHFGYPTDWYREKDRIDDPKEATDLFHDVQWNFADRLSLP